MKTLLILSVLALNAEVVQNNTTERNFTLPGKAVAKLILDNVYGSLTITGGAGREIRVTVREKWTAESDAKMAEARQQIKIDMKQDGDTVDIYVDGPFRDTRSGGGGTRAHGRTRREGRDYQAVFDFEVRVPQQTELDIATVNHGSVKIADVRGPFEVHNVNGGIEMSGASGGGQAHTVNGPVKITFASSPTAPSSFKTINGAITAVLPPDLNADVRVKTFNGQALTDFDGTALPILPIKSEREGGRFVLRTDRSGGFRVGRGGVELKFETLNGEIRIERRKN